MDRYLSRKRPRSSPLANLTARQNHEGDDDDASTDIKLAQLVSLFVELPQDTLLDVLVSCGGSVESAIATINAQDPSTFTPTKRKAAFNGSTSSASAIQTSLTSHIVLTPKEDKVSGAPSTLKRRPPLTQKGKTLHLFSPEDIAAHTPCTIIHNFLPAEQAKALLCELLDESQYFSRYQFQLFDHTVQSPHSASVYVATPEERSQHNTAYTYGGTYRSNVRQATPHLRAVSALVQRAVNEEIQKRILSTYPKGKKLPFQSPRQWIPNAAFANCYDGPAESVGFHSDDLTYVGPRPVIGSLSLGVQREFRVRRIVPEEENSDDDYDDYGEGVMKKKKDDDQERAHAQGQISIALPHNSLLVMHAEMQEEWKHAIVPAHTIEPHPLSGNRRINVTYRWFRDSLHPRNIPRCRCGAHAVLKCVQRRRNSRGRYMWMCYMKYSPGKKGCSFFQWADFDDDGEPVWKDTQARDDEDEEAPKLTNFTG